MKRARPAVDIVTLDESAFARALDDLAAILVDAVRSGASVGFVEPFTLEDARLWWRGLAPDVAGGRVIVLMALTQGRAIETAQLRLAQQPNARHRAEVTKLLVQRSARRSGAGTVLMSAVEEIAHRHRRTLLVLDTIAGSDAVRLYERLGWTRAGEIPRYAAFPDGSLAPTVIYFKDIENAASTHRIGQPEV